MVLNESASSEISRAPPAGARTDRSPAAREWDAAPTRRRDAVIARASTSAATTAAVAEPAATARIFTSAPMWNITQPDSNTAASGTETAISASPASWTPTVGARFRRYARTSPETRLPAATTRARWIISHSWVEPVADAPHRVQMDGPARVGFDLLPQPPHV